MIKVSSSQNQPNQNIGPVLFRSMIASTLINTNPMEMENWRFGSVQHFLFCRWSSLAMLVSHKVTSQHVFCTSQVTSSNQSLRPWWRYWGPGYVCGDLIDQTKTSVNVNGEYADAMGNLISAMRFHPITPLGLLYVQKITKNGHLGSKASAGQVGGIQCWNPVISKSSWLCCFCPKKIRQTFGC